MKILLITGFKESQQYSIDAEEAHKAYYLFLNPDKRGIFSNGLAIFGSDIRQIVPDWHGTMGWNKTHKLDTDDWNEINSKRLNEKMSDILAHAKDIAYLAPGNIALLNKPLSEIEGKKQLN